MSIPITVVPKRELLAYRADIKGSIFRQIRQLFNRAKGQEGFTQKHLAKRIDMDEGQLSRRLRGDYDLKLETLSDLARGLECRIDVILTPLDEVVVSKEEDSPKVKFLDPKEDRTRAKPANDDRDNRPTLNMEVNLPDDAGETNNVILSAVAA